MEIKEYATVCQEEMEIRNTVFVEEQGFTEELDYIDDIAIHLIMYDGEKAVGVCRIYDEDNTGEYHVGRVAVLKEYRGKGVGKAIMDVALKKIKALGGSVAILSAQKRVQGFYESCGYVFTGKEYKEQGCPHVEMKRDI